ncbi:MAG TPA: 3D domain-containing protein, partial [Planctomycetota bacterium]|nr:3D domain-containing protein [Planctomycetota bacterium]
AHNPHERIDGQKLYGKKVYIKQLDGLVLPTGEKHNGICYVGDAGGMVAYQQFDFFTGTQDYSGRLGLADTCDVQILD